MRSLLTVLVLEFNSHNDTFYPILKEIAVRNKLITKKTLSHSLTHEKRLTFNSII